MKNIYMQMTIDVIEKQNKIIKKAKSEEVVKKAKAKIRKLKREDLRFQVEMESDVRNF